MHFLNKYIEYKSPHWFTQQSGCPFIASSSGYQLEFIFHESLQHF